MEDLKKYCHDFVQIAKPIVINEEFQKMKYIDHHDESVYHHSLEVAYVSFVISRKFDLDVVSTIRGALLHDFYLYKFNKRTWKIFYDSVLHARDHPRIALDNAEIHFDLNKIERDIILKHMFPIRIPIYLESWVVSFADKGLATLEYTNKFMKIISQKKISSNDENILDN